MSIESEWSTDIGTPHIVGEDTLLLARLKESMRSPAISPLSLESCIFKVPQVLRRHNPKAYEPDVVSIGPFHRHRKQLRRMETVKRWYLRTLLTHMKKSFDEFIDMLMHEKGVIEFEKQAREFYAERLDHLSQSEFIEIMILDGCFIIQLLRNVSNDERKHDPILKMDCMFQYVCHDLLLLENQLPWFVLRTLYSVTLDSYSGSPSQFSEVLFEAFRSQNSFKRYFNSYLQHLNEIEQEDDETGQKILCSLFGVAFAPYITQKKTPGQKVNEDRVLHILDLIRTFIVFKFQLFEPSSRNNKKWLCWFGGKEEKKIGPEIPEIPTATALSEAGVKFERSSDNNLMNIEFKNGVLTIPELAVAELTEPLFRNLIAFEQCYHDRSHKITSYAFFMDKLISSDKDIKLLNEKQIIGNWLSVEDGSKFFNKLYIDTTVKDFKYKPLCAKVNKYYQVGWHKQLEILRHDYFASPWTVISLIAGIILLVLTLLQTIFTIYQ